MLTRRPRDWLSVMAGGDWAAGPPARRSAGRLQIPVELHRTQLEFFHSRAMFRGFVGGRGSGKSFVGAIDLLSRAMSAPPGRMFGLYAPTYRMLEDASLRALLDHDARIRQTYGAGLIIRVNRSSMRVTLGNGSVILCRSVDDPESTRGPNLSGAWLDEASLMPADAYPIIMACLREGGQQGWLSATFTPRGRSHWTYEAFGSGRPETALFRAATHENPWLPPGFEDTLRAQYPAHWAAQELEGQFIDPPGAVFRREWFRVVSAPPAGLQWCRYWDLAASTRASADYTASVAVAMGQDGTVYLRDMVRGRWEWPDQERIMIQVMLSEPQTRQGIEKALHGAAAVQDLVRRPELAGIAIEGISPEGDKLTRSLALAARAEQGKVALVAGPWNAPFIDELCSFTGDGSTHDDQVDSAAGGLLMLMRSRSRRIVAW